LIITSITSEVSPWPLVPFLFPNSSPSTFMSLFFKL
jgi:hypothetical protein